MPSWSNLTNLKFYYKYLLKIITLNEHLNNKKLFI